MTCSVVVVEGNGSPVTWTPMTGIVGRYCTMDSYQPGTANPCKVPATSFYYSFWKHTAIAGSGSFNSVRNIYWFCDGNVADDWDLGTGGALLGGKRNSSDNGCPNSVAYHGSDSYQVAAGTIGTTGTAIDAVSGGHEYYHDQSPATIDLDTCTSAQPLLIDSTQYTTDFRSKALVSQVKIAPTGVQGDKAAKTFTFMYDEY
jgi:hypothetical protein